MEQKIIISTETQNELKKLWDKHNVKKVLIVCDAAFPFLETHDEYVSLSIPYVIFNDFTSNPLYEDVIKGVALLKENGCDAILAIGGGSALDVAKCIKLFATMDESKVYLEQEFKDNALLLIAIPTTSGTGSESTRYAVIYYDGKKQSVTHNSIVPSYAILDHRNLKTLPIYQKKCTMMDAFCQSIESWWSVNATQESRGYAKRALNGIIKYMDSYVNNEEEGNKGMMIAANYAGKAICISQTTAAHAMSYKLTSLYKIPHGRAAFMCLPYIWKYMWNVVAEGNSKEYDELKDIFKEIATEMGCEDVRDAINTIFQMNKKLFSNDSVEVRMEDVDVLTDSVNPVRLGNNPVKLSQEVLHDLYSEIISETLTLGSDPTLIERGISNA